MNHCHDFQSRRRGDKIDTTGVDAAQRKFSPEFMNRIDKVVVFRTLRPEHLEQILEIELGMLQQRVLSAPPTTNSSSVVHRL